MKNIIKFENISDYRDLSEDIDQIYYLNMFYEKAVEVKSHIESMPSIHILIGKSEDDNYYRGLCLESGIMYISSSTILTEPIIEEIVTNSISMAIDLFYRSDKDYKLKAFTSGRVTNSKFWETYNYFIMKMKNKLMKENLNKHPIKDLINSYCVKIYNK